VAFEVAWCGDQYVEWYPETLDLSVEPLSGEASVGTFGHDNEDVDVAVRTHLAAGGRAEKDDPQRMNRLDDLPHKVVKHGRIGFHAG
jgi:hypothetical protein